MAYSLPTAVEPLKRTPGVSRASPKTHTPGPQLQERGYRYYSPELGRWTSRDPIGERPKKTLASRVHEAGLRSRLTPADLEKLLGIHLAEEEQIRINTLNLQLFCFNNPVNNHDRDGLCVSLVEAILAAITVGGVAWAIYKIKQKQDKLKELDPLSQEGAACMLDAAAGAVGDGVGGGGGPVSGAIVEKALQEAFKKCQKCEKEDDKTCSWLKDIE